MSTVPQNVFVGIDVSEDWLDVAVRPTGAAWRAAQDEDGVEQLVRQLEALRPQLIVMEASGGHERLPAAVLAAAGLPVAVVNARHVRDFARSHGKLAKTDRLDAAVIAHFGEVSELQPQPPVPAEARELAALVTRRRQLVRMRTVELQHRKQAAPVVRRGIDRTIAFLNQELEEIDEDLTRRLRESPLWRERDELLRSVPGVGPALSFVLLADLPELGPLSNKQVASLVGLAPFARDSWEVPWSAHLLGRSRGGEGSPLHADGHGNAVQPGDQGVLWTAGQGGQASEGRAHRVHAQAAHGPQRHAPARDSVGPPDGLTSNTVAPPSAGES